MRRVEQQDDEADAERDLERGMLSARAYPCAGDESRRRRIKRDAGRVLCVPDIHGAAHRQEPFTHLHTAVYEYLWEAAADGGPPASLALERGFPGVVAIAVTNDDDATTEAWAGQLVGPRVPMVVGLRQDWLLVSVLGEPEPHSLVLAFVDGDVIDVWRRRVQPALGARTDVGFAGPFLATLPSMQHTPRQALTIGRF